ncbi:peptidoglycan-binding protein [Myxococcota bacterium]|nr:peptidoglycan-binding protein [Myxococcota bacterium]
MPDPIVGNTPAVIQTPSVDSAPKPAAQAQVSETPVIQESQPVDSLTTSRHRHDGNPTTQPRDLISNALTAPTALKSADKLTHPAFKESPTLNKILTGTKVLEMGSRGGAIKVVQEALTKVGYPLDSDGLFGAKSRTAVIHFQESAKLEATGIVDKATLLALDKSVNPPSHTESLKNTRFEGTKELSEVLAGKLTLASGAKGGHVKKVQSALIGMGFKMPQWGADGSYGGETEAAVRRLQFEAGIRPITGNIDAKTLSALDKLAPPEGKKLDLNVNYDKLFEDGRLDMTIAIGYDETGLHHEGVYGIRANLWDAGFERFRPEDLDDAKRAELGVGADRYIDGATYFKKEIEDKDGKEVQIVVRLIDPNSYPDPKNVVGSFHKALAEDEVVIYNGHARYGTGPDFDDIDSEEGNFIIDRKGNRVGSPPPKHLLDHISEDRKSDLPILSKKPDYQVLFFNGCSTENYLHNLRSNQFAGRDMDNTDIIATTRTSLVIAGPDQVGTFVNGLMERESMSTMMEEMNQVQQDIYMEFDMPVDAEESRNIYISNGLSANSATRTIDEESQDTSPTLKEILERLPTVPLQPMEPQTTEPQTTEPQTTELQTSPIDITAPIPEAEQLDKSTSIQIDSWNTVFESVKDFFGIS